MSDLDRKHLHEIDALRGIAAVLVAFIFHNFFLFGQPLTGPFAGYPIVDWFYECGWTMVDLFFVVSGFVFSHVYLSNNRMRSGTTAKSFFIARFARLYPLHILTTLVIILPLSMNLAGRELYENLDLYHFIQNVFMVHGFGANHSYNAVTWSISVELMCYALFFVFAVLGGRAMTLLAVGSIAAGILLALPGGSVAEWHIGRGLSGFFAGYFAWRLRKHHISTGVLLVVAVLPFFWVPRFMDYGVYLGLTAFPAAVLLAERLPILSAQIFRWFGERSYSIYLWHPIVYFSLKIYVPEIHNAPESQQIAAVITAIVVTLAVSDLAYRFFEVPMRKKVRDALSGKPQKDLVSVEQPLPLARHASTSPVAVSPRA